MLSKKKIICILRSNPVDPDSRVEKEAVTLKRLGYEVSILAWDRESNHKPKNDVLSLYGENIPITRYGYRASYGDGFKNIIPFMKFQFMLMRQLIFRQFDVVHACDLDTALFTYRIALNRKRKFVYDIFDFDYSSPKNFLQAAIKKIQINIIDKSSGTIICTEDRIKQIQGSSPKHLAIIHNSPSEEMISSIPQRLYLNSSAVKVVYVGILQDYRLLRELGSFFSEHPEYEFHVGGFGKYESYFKDLARDFPNIFFYGKIQYSDTIKLEQACDIMLAIYDPQVDNHRYAAPNKFYESLMLGKPVIMAKGSGMSNVVDEFDLGAVIDYSIIDFEIKLKELVYNRAAWPQISSRMKQLYQSKYSWGEMENRLRELYEKILEK